MRFDANAAIAALTQRLIVAMKQLQGEFLNEARQGMRTPEGAESLYEGDVTIAAGIISAEVIGGAYAAMDEYGTGSAMDTSSPAFLDYRMSDLWNPARHDTTIRTRPAGPYENIFGETKVARGPGGFNLERKGGKYEPQQPSHALETAARWMQNGRMQRVIEQALADMDWGRFFVEDRR